MKSMGVDFEGTGDVTIQHDVSPRAAVLDHGFSVVTGTAQCPDLATLEVVPLPTEIRGHVDSCEVCRLVIDVFTDGRVADDCSRYDALLAARLDGSLNAAGNNLLDRHLAGCASCRAVAHTLSPSQDRGGDHATLPHVDPASYALGLEVARGGMGRILAARDLRVGRPVAVKELLGRSPALATRFEREARVTARLQHPGIVPIYEIGRWPDDTPFYSMRMVDGRTLAAAIAQAHTLDTRLGLLPALIAACEAVAFAHSQRIIHRDLTPANVLVGAYGETVVIDWGLAKDLAAGTTEDDLGPYRGDRHDDALTDAGTVVGTLAYMPPEQARAELVDERADVYALGAILYHLLAGVPPYRARNAGDLIEQVKAAAPLRIDLAAPGTPRDLVSIVGKAMAGDPNARYPSAREVADELVRFQAGRMVEAHVYTTAERIQRFVRRNRGAVIVTALAAVVLAIAGAFGITIHRRNIAHAIDKDVALAEQSWTKARTEVSARADARRTAFAAWDHMDSSAAERAWGEAGEHANAAREIFATAAADFERALLRDADRAEVRARYGKLLFDRAVLADDEHRTDERDELVRRLANYDIDGTLAAKLSGSGELTIDATPTDARIELARYDGSGRLVIAARSRLQVGAGAWIATATANDVTVHLPIAVARGEHRTVALTIPPPSAIPTDFVYIPAGDALFGSSDPEVIRTWTTAVAAHVVHVDSYAIKKHETTFAEWIEFLQDLPDPERDKRTPKVVAVGSKRGTLALSLRDGRWHLAYQVSDQLLQAASGELIHYEARKLRRDQDWLKMPVAAVSFDDAAAYAQWLDRTRRVPGARMCTEIEWERAARGTADRRFPHSDVLGPDDANVDITYGKQRGAYGPDEVGSHPASRSPFGVDDLTGNVWEWTTSSQARNEVAVRGGAYYFDATTAWIANRETPEAPYRGLTVGVRICATPALK